MGPPGSWRQRGSRRRDLRVALLVGIANDRIGIGDVEIVADQRHAERRVEMIEEHALHFGLAVPVRVAQQRDAVAFAGVAARGRPGLRPIS